MKPIRNVAIVYDRVNKWGGAERLLLALHKIFPQAPLFTSVLNISKTPWAQVFKIYPSFLQQIPLLRNHHEFVPFLMPLAFESFNFSDFDLVISVTSAEAKGIVTKPGTLHICYCLTPTRYLWIMNPRENYHSFGLLEPLARLLKRPLLGLLKKWDMVAKERPDAYIAISTVVQKRLKKYYQANSSVIYPPLDDQLAFPTQQSGEYFLIVTRLVGYKRIDLAIKVANKLRIPLKIVGIGQELNRLKKLAGATVDFLGFQSNSDLAQIYSRSIAVIVPGEEEFCLTALEAQANGKPVIAYRPSGVAEIIIEDKTGVLFNDQNVKSLEKVFEKFSKMTFNPEECRENAQRFSFGHFKAEFLSEVEKITERANQLEPKM